MADLEAYKDKFGDSGQRVLQNAMNESKRRAQNYVAVEQQARATVNEGDQREEPYRHKCALPPYLKHSGVSLSRMARAHKIPPTIGREKEIQPRTEILCHRGRANSPMLVGEPGVGKTA